MKYQKSIRWREALAAIAGMLWLRRTSIPTPPLDEAAAATTLPTAQPTLPPPVTVAPMPPPPPVPLGDGWLALVEQSSGHALVLEPLMRHAGGSWRQDWPDPVEDDGAQSATSLVLRLRNDWLSRAEALPKDWRTWDAGGIERAVTVSAPTTIKLGCMRGAGLRTDLPMPSDVAAFRDVGEGEMVLVDPLVVVSGLARPVPAEFVAPGSTLETLAWSVLADLDQLEAASIERWAVEVGTEDGRVKGTGIALDAAARASSGSWKLSVQAACSPVAGAVPLLFTATRTHPYTVPIRALDCASIVAVSGWALVRGEGIERLDGTVRVERGDCDQFPRTPRVLAFLEDGERRLAVEIELGFTSVNVVLVHVSAEGVERILVVPHGGC